MKSVIVVIVILLLVCITEWIRELYTFKVTHYQIKSKKLSRLGRPRKVVVLSDLHNNCFGNQNTKLLNAIRKEAPDLILITGDMLIGKSTVSTDIARDFVMSLPEICKTYYANGNHEQRMKERPEFYGDVYASYKKCLEQRGVIFVENANVLELWDGCKIRIFGLEIPLNYYQKWKKLTLPMDAIEQAIGNSNSDEYQILIAHNPAFMDSYLEWGADLVLSGHLHGGVARIPGIGGIITPQFRLFPKYSGEYTKVNDAAAVVSKGLGTHTLKVRFLNPAEVVVLEIGG